MFFLWNQAHVYDDMHMQILHKLNSLQNHKKSYHVTELFEYPFVRIITSSCCYSRQI